MKIPIFIGMTMLITRVFGSIPSYIHVCGRRNPNINHCILNSVTKLVPQLPNGIPELDVPATEPLLIDQVTVTNMTNFKAIAHHVKLYGISNFTADKLNFDLKTRILDVDLYFKEIKLDADYTFDAKILVPLSGAGPIQMILPDVKATVKLQYDVITHKGKQYLHFYKMTTDLTLKKYTATFNAREGKGGDQNVLTAAVNDVLVNNQSDVLDNVKPNMEKHISEITLDFVNKICKHFTYEELLPDRE